MAKNIKNIRSYDSYIIRHMDEGIRNFADGRKTEISMKVLNMTFYNLV